MIKVKQSTIKYYIVIGQYLGIGVLTSISIIGALHEYIGLLGLVPIYLGIKEYKSNSYTLSFLIKMIRV